MTGDGGQLRRWLRAYWPKLVSGLAITTVAAVTGRISYTHIYELTLALHQPVMVARLMPFGVDGLIVVGSVILLDATPVDWWLGWLGIGPGAAVSLFANVMSGIRYGWLAAAWAGVPAAAFTLATFMLERWLKAQASRPDAPLARVAADAQSAALAALRATTAAGNPLSGRQLETRFGLSRADVTRVRELAAAESNGHAPHRRTSRITPGPGALPDSWHPGRTLPTERNSQNVRSTW